MMLFVFITLLALCVQTIAAQHGWERNENKVSRLRLVRREGSFMMTPPSEQRGDYVAAETLSAKQFGDLDPEDFMDDPIWPNVTCRDLEVSIQSNFADLLDPRHLPNVNITRNMCMNKAARVRKDAAPMVSVKTPAKLPLQFLHVSKTAGTYFCDCVSGPGGIGLNQAHPADRATNCHILQEDRPMWGTQNVPDWAVLQDSDVHELDCAGKLAAFKTAQVDVEGVENYLGQHEPCGEFLNVIFVRDPMSRLISHLLEIQLASPNIINTLSVDQVISMWPIVTNNYFIRCLLGFEVFKLPSGQITASHLDEAKRVLSSFDHIIVADATINGHISQQLGYDCSGHQGRSHGPGATAKAMEELQQIWGAEGWKKLQDLNQFDQQLFQHSLLLRFIATGP